MRKSKEQLEAEAIFASLLREKTKEEILLNAKKYAESYRYAIAQRVTVTILLCTLWDMWEDFDEKQLNETYEQYLKYHESFNAGKENIYKQMVEIDKMLGGDLLEGKLFDVVKELGKE